MKLANHSLIIVIAAIGFFFFGNNEAKAQDSINIRDTFKKTYFVEVQYHFYHWTSGGQQIYWSTILETDSYSEAQAGLKAAEAALESGDLDSSGTTTVTTAIDVRIRTEYEYPYYMTPYSKFKYNFR